MHVCSLVEEAEGQAILTGLTALSAMYCGSLIVETDCSRIAEELCESNQNRSACFSVVSDINSTAGTFSAIEVNAVRRGKNKLAHKLAARGRREGDLLIITDVPEDLRPLMALFGYSN